MSDGEERNAGRILMRKHNENQPFERKGVGRIMLRSIFEL
jgi:hypothetical protein